MTDRIDLHEAWDRADRRRQFEREFHRDVLATVNLIRKEIPRDEPADFHRGVGFVLGKILEWNNRHGW